MLTIVKERMDFLRSQSTADKIQSQNPFKLKVMPGITLYVHNIYQCLKNGCLQRSDILLNTAMGPRSLEELEASFTFAIFANLVISEIITQLQPTLPAGISKGSSVRLPTTMIMWSCWGHLASFYVFFLLPPAYVIRREDNVFIGVCLSVCLHRCGGWGWALPKSGARTGFPLPWPGTGQGVPSPYPQPGSGQGVPSPTPSQDQDREYPRLSPSQDQAREYRPPLPHPGQYTPWTGYAAGGMPFAVTQEDFLVFSCTFTRKKDSWYSLTINVTSFPC